MSHFFAAPQKKNRARARVQAKRLHCVVAISQMLRESPAVSLLPIKTAEILRTAMRESLPHNIVSRPKKGFGVPIADWIRGPLREMAHDLLAPDKLRREGFFRG